MGEPETKKPGVMAGAGRTGSVLILVLWVLVLIGFLAQEYLVHNRGKAALALTSRQDFETDLAIDSLLSLLDSGNWPQQKQEGEQQAKSGEWISLSPANVALWAKMEDESGRHDLNSVSEDKIREVIRVMMGTEETGRADEITDAILDWRDDDDLTHEHGAEKEAYEAMDAGYLPANGPFKTLTELLMVKGVYPDIFWGNPLARMQESLESGVEAELLEAEDSVPKVDSLVDGFTIFSKNTWRISVLIPGNFKAYFFGVYFVSRARNGKWDVTARLTAWLTPPEKDEDSSSSPNG